MRLVTLVIILLVVGAISYVLIFQRDWVFKRAGEAVDAAQGFTPAKTPQEAMDKFVKAIKERNYHAAGTYYCTSEYGEELKRAHKAASRVGTGIDKILNLMKDRPNLDNDRGRLLLVRLDPFPPGVQVKEIQKVWSARALGSFVPDPLVVKMLQTQQDGDLAIMDPKVLRCVLMPPALTIPPFQVDIVAEGKDKDIQWKLDFPVTGDQRAAISHFIEKYEPYVERLEYLNEKARTGVYSGPGEFGEEIVGALKHAK